MDVRLQRDSRVNQRGVAILLLVVVLSLAAAAMFYGLSRPTNVDVIKERKTATALEQAKAALIGNALSANLQGAPPSTIRPGDFPCPDINDDGLANDGSCGDSTVTAGQSVRIGRLPWKTLGIPDLRDGDGERLWYAVSNNFKNNSRTTCTAMAPEATTCLNSDTRGTITIRNAVGTIVYDATNPDPASSGVIAVVFSVGAVLRRDDGVLQVRSCSVGLLPSECTSSGVCNSIASPKCNPTNYLDIRGTEDNANFADGTTNGFVNGIARDTNNNVVVNDRLMVITYEDLMPQIEKRVVGEVSKCLVAYANVNFGRYPWAASVADVTTPFSDGLNTFFGRIPDRPLLQTRLGIVPTTPPSTVGNALEAACTATPNLCMKSFWPPIGCNLPLDPTQDSWWNNWKLLVFYGVADAYKPQIVYTQPTLATVILGSIALPSGCPSCLTVSPPSSAGDKQFVVIASGKRLPGVTGTEQPRSSIAARQDPTNYLELENNNSDTVFTKQPKSVTFNDSVLYK